VGSENLNLLSGGEPSCLHLPGAVRIHVRLPNRVTAELVAAIPDALHARFSWGVNCRPASTAVLWIRITTHTVESGYSRGM
jgi:hypothetical protein